MPGLNFPVLYKSMDIRAEQVIAQAVQAAISDAEALWQPEKFDGVFPTKGFGIRRLTARDMMGTNGAGGTSIWAGDSGGCWTLSIAAASHAWTNIISGAMVSDSCYLVLTGFFNLDGAPDIDAIKISADGIEYPIIDLQEMYGWDVANAYFTHPIIIRPEKTFTVAACARLAGVKRFGFLGYTIAKRSYLIAQL